MRLSARTRPPPPGREFMHKCRQRFERAVRHRVTVRPRLPTVDRGDSLASVDTQRSMKKNGAGLAATGLVEAL